MDWFKRNLRRSKSLPPSTSRWWRMNPPPWAAVVGVVAVVLLVAAYTRPTLHITRHLPRESPCVTMAKVYPDHLIPWELKDQHPAGMAADILKLKRPEYSPDYKNPCWMEQTQKGMKLRCLPYFFVAGFPKCGTTDLWQSLCLHPQVRVPGKEPHWWTRKQYIKNETVESYVKRFDRPAKKIQKQYVQKDGRQYHKLITGDGSASTVWDNRGWPHIPENCNYTERPVVLHAHLIKHILPQAKILVILRNPIDRLYSDFLYFKGVNNRSQSEFHTQCVRAVQTTNQCLIQNDAKYCLHIKVSDLQHSRQVHLHIGMYSVYIKEWLSIFPREQLHFVQMEEYSRDRAKALQDVFNFLGLDPLEDEEQINELPVQNKRRLKARKVGRMFNTTRDMLYEFYKPYNEELSWILQDPKYNFSKSNQ